MNSEIVVTISDSNLLKVKIQINIIYLNFLGIIIFLNQSFDYDLNKIAIIFLKYILLKFTL